MKILIGILSVFYTLIVDGQINNSINERVIGGPDRDAFNTRILIPNSTDYFIVSSSSSNNCPDKSEDSRGGYDIWLLKMNANNDIIWDKTIGGSDNDIVESAILKDSIIFIIVRSFSPISGEKTVPNIAAPDDSKWLLSVDFNGNILWQRNVGNSMQFLNSTLLALKNDNLLVASSVEFQLLRLDEFNPITGDSILTTFLSLVSNTIVSSVSQDSSGFLYVFCAASAGVNGVKTDNGCGSKDAWILKLTENYVRIKDKCFGGSSIESGGLSLFNNNFIYLFTHSYSGISGNKSTANIGEGDCWVVKTDLDLNIIWDKSFGGLQTETPVAVSWESNGSSNILLSVGSNSAQSGNKTSVNYGLNDLWVLKLDTNGNIIAQKNIGGSDVDLGMVYSNDNLSNQNSFCGTSSSPVSGVKTLASKGYEDIWLFNFNADELLSINETTVFGNINVFPNPFQDKVTFSFPEINETLHLKIFTLDGKTVYESSIKKNTLIKEVNLTDSKAIYFYEISGEKVSVSGKLVKVN